MTKKNATSTCAGVVLVGIIHVQTTNHCDAAALGASDVRLRIRSENCGGPHLCNLCVDTRWLAHVLRDRPDDSHGKGGLLQVGGPVADALWYHGFKVALLTLCLFVGGEQKKVIKITISTRKAYERSMSPSSSVHRTVTHNALHVQPHPFAILAQVPLFPVVAYLWCEIVSQSPVPPEFREVGSSLLLLIMDSFVAAVDETPTTPEVQEAVVTALVGAGFTNPEHLVGTADSVIGELAGWLAGPAGGYSSARSGVPKTCRRPNAQRRQR